MTDGMQFWGTRNGRDTARHRHECLEWTHTCGCRKLPISDNLRKCKKKVQEKYPLETHPAHLRKRRNRPLNGSLFGRILCQQTVPPIVIGWIAKKTLEQGEAVGTHNPTHHTWLHGLV